MYKRLYDRYTDEYVKRILCILSGVRPDRAPCMSPAENLIIGFEGKKKTRTRAEKGEGFGVI